MDVRKNNKLSYIYDVSMAFSVHVKQNTLYPPYMDTLFNMTFILLSLNN
jgi:hypothetical protein